MNCRKLLKTILIGISLTTVNVSCVQNSKNESAVKLSNETPIEKGATKESSIDISQSKYSEAFNSFRNGHVIEAINQFKESLNNYPNSFYADKGQFWLGEAYRVNKDVDLAKKAFNLVLEKYPTSDKVPDALLKLGKMEMDLNNSNKAKEYFSRLITNYPASKSSQTATELLSQTGSSTLPVIPTTEHENIDIDSEDQILTSKVKSVLVGDSSLKNSNIAIKTYKGFVQLSGFVTQAESDRAVQLVRTTKGVKAVNNTLVVTPNYEIPTTSIVKESSIVPVPTTESVVNNLEEIKSKCKELGFKPKSDKFGKCVLELTK